MIIRLCADSTVGWGYSVTARGNEIAPVTTIAHVGRPSEVIEAMRNDYNKIRLSFHRTAWFVHHNGNWHEIIDPAGPDLDHLMTKTEGEVEISDTPFA